MGTNAAVSTTVPTCRIAMAANLNAANSASFGLMYLNSTGPQVGAAIGTWEGATDYSATLVVTRGQVGIGTASLSVPFTIAKLGNVDPFPTLGIPSGKLFIQADGPGFGLFMGVASSGNSWIQAMRGDSGATSYAIVLNPSGGNVGVGMNPSYQLQLSTDSAAKPSTSTWTVPSDARLKQNIRDLEGGLAVIERLHVIEAEYNGLAGTPAGARVVGFLAHELREILPTAVGSVRGKLHPRDKEHTDILDMNIHEVLLHSILAIQQLSAMVQQQRKPV